MSSEISKSKATPAATMSTSFPTTPRQSDRRTSLKSPNVILRTPPPRSISSQMHEPIRIPSYTSSDIADGVGEAVIGDLVEVPGGWHGTVMYVGPVHGRNGLFLGVDLIALDADKGRHDGTYNGVSYFPTKTKNSGMFVPQGKCRVIDSNLRKDRNLDTRRPSSGQLHVRPSSRLRSVSGRSVSETQNISTPPTNITKAERSETIMAAAQQKLLNENARLSKAVEELERKLLDTQKAKAIQHHEMEELISTVAELEALQGPQSETGVASNELLELRAYIENREAKIEQLRSEAEVRRTEFKQVTEHQQATIEELKAMHADQISQLEIRRNVLEERLLVNGDVSMPDDQEQMNLLQDQLAEISEELDALVGNQERARQDIDLANARINELELENNRLLDELENARTKVEDARTTTSSQLSQAASRRVLSMEDLPETHPQKRQTIEFLENEIARLKQEVETLKAKADGDPTTGSGTEAIGSSHLQAVIAELQAENDLKMKAQEEIKVLRLELDTEKQARRSLEAQNDQLENTLERTILQLNTKSPRSIVRSNTNGVTVQPPTPSTPTKIDKEVGYGSPPAERVSRLSRSPTVRAADVAPDGSELWCEFCEESGHDIISCKAVFGSAEPTPAKKHAVTSPTVDDDEMF